MDDDDEIDVLGDFNLENLLSKNEEQLSSCYDGEHQLGLHCNSPWMLDTSTQPYWYDNRADPQTSAGSISAINSGETCDSNVWSDKEKYLLEKGLELFGKSYSRLAQYIGSKTSSQVKSYVKTMGLFGWNGKSSMSTSSYGIDGVDFNFTELIDDMEIPASMEEVIAVVSTAQPTVILPTSQRETAHKMSSSAHRRGKCRRKKNKRKKNRDVSTRYKSNPQIYNAEKIMNVLTDHKEQDSIVLPNGEQVIRMRHEPSLNGDADVDIDVDSDSGNVKEEELAAHESLNLEDHIVYFDYTIAEGSVELPYKVENESKGTTSSSEDAAAEASGQESPIVNDNCIKEELINSQDESFESELHNNLGVEMFVDVIESEVSVFTDGFVTEEEQEVDINTEKEPHIFKGDLITPSGRVMTVIVDDMPTIYPSVSNVDFNTTHSDLSKYVSSSIKEEFDSEDLLPPTKDSTIDLNLVTEEEDGLHSKFFSDSQDGQNRYKKIRNHIIDCWNRTKPAYVSKSSVLTGLKNSGDINLINRIHTYLEQKGYINNSGFQQQVYSSVPSCYESKKDEDLYQDDISGNDGRDPDLACSETALESVALEKRESSRPRKKKLPFDELCVYTEAFTYESEQHRSIVMQEHNEDILAIQQKTKIPKRKKSDRNTCNGGYTMVHMDSGEVIVQHNRTAQPNKVSTRGIKPIKLIHCKNYTVSNKAPYRIEMDVAALLLVDIHGHLSPKCEVIGLLGGVFKTSENILCITMAVPCRTILSSNVHCDMCPVSQCESSELITSRGLSVVGWYHSHPNFDPSPSDTDVDTQNILQSWFNDTGKPFVGLIMSPYFPAQNVSAYRFCLVKMENHGPVPYQMDAKLINLNQKKLPRNLRESVEAAHKTLQNYEPIKHINVYKCLESVKAHLKKATPKLEEPNLSHVLQQIREFFNTVSFKRAR